MSDDSINLTYLLSSIPYSLAYTLPLLCLSFVLTFAGTFLMLDRSRSFPPSADYSTLPGAFEKPRKRRFIWVFEGGIGGLASGYITGLHLATFLSLLIPATTSSASLSPKSFLAVWVLTCTVLTLLAGRYRYAALAFSGVSGGALTSLALCVILHPSITPRIVLMAILVPLLAFLILLFYFVPNFHSTLLHPTLRFCTASIGAFGISLSISLLLHPRVDGWANVWEHLWLRDGENWDTGREKGLSAAYGIFLAIGMASDWGLRRWLGECPDEKWDSYLANYTANLPNQTDRAGTFEPPKSFWDRLLLSKDCKKDPIIFPPDSDLKIHSHLVPSLVDLNARPPVSVPGAHLKKSRSQSKKYRIRNLSRKRKPIKFGAIDELSSSSDEEISDSKASPILAAPALSYSSSTPTLVDEPPKALRKKHTNNDLTKPLTIDYDAELTKLKKLKGTDVDGMPDYSDHEEDLTSLNQRRHSVEHGRWSPGFMKRHSPGSSDAVASGLGVPPLSTVPVPATPSLIKALDRIAIAQKQAFPQSATPLVAGNHSSEAAPRALQGVTEVEEEDNAGAAENERRERAPRWEEFWREVRVRAQS